MGNGAILWGGVPRMITGAADEGRKSKHSPEPDEDHL
jgi:hypothetical protein